MNLGKVYQKAHKSEKDFLRIDNVVYPELPRICDDGVITGVLAYAWKMDNGFNARFLEVCCVSNA